MQEQEAILNSYLLLLPEEHKCNGLFTFIFLELLNPLDMNEKWKALSNDEKQFWAEKEEKLRKKLKGEIQQQTRQEPLASKLKKKKATGNIDEIQKSVKIMSLNDSKGDEDGKVKQLLSNEKSLGKYRKTPHKRFNLQQDQAKSEKEEQDDDE